MTTLRITVEWLDGAYHGREWPPSPFRLYQAMLAGYAVHQRGNPVLKAAMRHLETLAPPTITAPLTDTQSPVTACVPNNDGDRVLALLAAGKPAGARALRAKSVTLRTRHARRFDGVVTYDWPATPATAEHIAAIATIAACISALGLGIDVAVAHATLFAQPGAARGVRYAPSPTARRTLNVPYRGAFEDLEVRYRALRTRMDSNTLAPVWEPAPRPIGYECELDLPGLRCAGFALRSLDDTSLAVEGTRAMDVAAMVRHALGCVARRARLGETTIAELMGHGNGDKRIWVQPLPNAGHRHADGRIRRVMLTAPEGVDEDDWDRRAVATTGRTSCPCGAAEPDRHPGAAGKPGSHDGPVPGRGEAMDDGHTGRAARARPTTRQTAPATHDTKTVAPRRHRGSPPGIGDDGARRKTSRERASSSLPSTRALGPLSVHTYVCAMENAGDGTPRARGRDRIRARTIRTDRGLKVTRAERPATPPSDSSPVLLFQRCPGELPGETMPPGFRFTAVP